MQQVSFYFSGSRESINIFNWYKKFGQYKKNCLIKFAHKKRTYRKIFRSMWNFLELQCLVDDLVDSELLMITNASLP